MDKSNKNGNKNSNKNSNRRSSNRINDNSVKNEAGAVRDVNSKKIFREPDSAPGA